MDNLAIEERKGRVRGLQERFDRALCDLGFPEILAAYPELLETFWSFHADLDDLYLGYIESVEIPWQNVIAQVRKCMDVVYHPSDMIIQRNEENADRLIARLRGIQYVQS